MLTLELLTATMQSQRALQLAQAIRTQASAAGVRVIDSATYTGRGQVLLLWGPGAPDRVGPMLEQVARGGHVAAFDLAYWQRDRKVRVSFDHAHPQAWVMRRMEPRARFLADRVAVSDRWNPDGPVVIAGIGRKARVQYGDAVDVWERAMIAEARARWDCRVLYRRKQADAPTLAGVPQVDCTSPIEQVLAGARLVVTWHSNVAVDAIRLGIPVVCRDGAAAAVAPATLPECPTPLATDVRDAFLSNLAWYQWTPGEAGQMLRWMQEVLA